MKFVPLSSITISPQRQRKEIYGEDLVDLANSISSLGLLHPIVVRSCGNSLQLVAGERRLKAIDYLYNLNETFYHDSREVPDGFIPVTDIGDLDPIDAFECELEENLQRVDLTWQERSEATSQLYELRRLQSEKRGNAPLEPAKFAQEVYPQHVPTAAQAAVRKELMVAKQLKDPEVAGAKSIDEAVKVIKRKEEAARNTALGEAVGRTFSARDHTLLQGDCVELLQELPEASFDVILTDPPYGINAQDFNDSGGKAQASGHTYDDSYQRWEFLSVQLAREAFRLAKPQAHFYCFCDIDNFAQLRNICGEAGWEYFRTPLIWHNPSSQRAPWPHHGPHRRYQMCLYAMKGKRPVLKLSPDVVTYASDENLGWAAQKPVALLTDLLQRSCRAGDSVLDPFCGSGSIFPAAHAMKVKATGIELDPVAYGIAAKRLGGLK